MLASDPDRKRPSRKVCPTCGASPGGCNGLRFMSGRFCCTACRGDHDERTPATEGSPT